MAGSGLDHTPSGDSCLLLEALATINRKGDSSHLRSLAEDRQGRANDLSQPGQIGEIDPDPVAGPVTRRVSVSVGFGPKAEVGGLDPVGGDALTAEVLDQQAGPCRDFVERRLRLGPNRACGEVELGAVGDRAGTARTCDSDTALHGCHSGARSFGLGENVEMGPLGGFRVVEMAGIGPVPWAGMMLSGLGAEVIRIDRVQGGNALDGWFGVKDPTRRDRRSIALDLKQGEAVAVVLDLLDGADALIEGFRPGVMERLGLGPEPCLVRNPKLVYGRMTGWGQEGPRARTAGHDLNYLSLTGVLSAIGPAENSVPPLNLIGDYGGGAMLLVAGVLSGLLAVGRGQPGQVVDAAMVDGVALLAALLHGMQAGGGWVETRASNLLDGGAPFYRTYRTSDGGEMAVGALEPQFFAELIEGLGLDLENLPSQYDRRRWSELETILAEAFGALPREHWETVFEGSDACVSPVRRWSEAQTDPHLKARRTLTEVDGVVQAAPAPRFSHSQLPAPGRPTQAGQHTIEILVELGYNREAIGMLIEHKAVVAMED